MKHLRFPLLLPLLPLLLCTRDLNTNPLDPSYQGDYAIRADWEIMTSGDLEILRTYRFPFQKGRDEYLSLSPITLVDTAPLLSSYRSDDSLALRFTASFSGPLLIRCRRHNGRIDTVDTLACFSMTTRTCAIPTVRQFTDTGRVLFRLTIQVYDSGFLNTICV